MESITIANKPQISFIDYPSKNKSAMTYYMYGCEFNCPGCQNIDLQNYEITDNDFIQVIKMPKNFIEILVKNDDKMNNSQRLVVLQGGDPLYPRNRAFTLEMLRLSAEMSTGLRFCIYTGYSFEDVKRMMRKTELGFEFGADGDDKYLDFLSTIPYIKCGTYDMTKPNEKIGKHDGKMYFATTNQKLFRYNPKNRRYEPASINGVSDLAFED